MTVRCRTEINPSRLVGCCLIALSVRFFCDPTDFGLPGSSSMGLPKQEYWSGLPLPPPGCLHYPGIQPGSLASPALHWQEVVSSLQDETMGLNGLRLQAGPGLLFFFFFSVHFIVLESEADYRSLLMELWGSRPSRSSQFRGKKCSHHSQIAGYWGEF